MRKSILVISSFVQPKVTKTALKNEPTEQTQPTENVFCPLLKNICPPLLIYAIAPFN